MVYKRTHVGDPDGLGNFGCGDCMGAVRGFQYDAVIGVGGISADAISHGINEKITWIGIGPSKIWPAAGEKSGARGPLVTFKKFARWDEKGIPLIVLAPLLARRLFERKARYLLESYSDGERAEALEVLKLISAKKFNMPKTSHFDPIGLKNSRIRSCKVC